MSDMESPVLHQVRSARFPLSEKGEWIAMEVRKVVADWFRWPEENLGLAIQAVDSSGKTVIAADLNETDGLRVSSQI